MQVTWINVPDESGSTSKQAAREIAQTDCTALISLFLPFLRSPFTLRFPILPLLSLSLPCFSFSPLCPLILSPLSLLLSLCPSFSLFYPLYLCLFLSLSFPPSLLFCPSVPPTLTLSLTLLPPSLSFSPFLILYLSLSLSLFFAFRLRLFFSALLLPQQKEAGGIFRR